MGCLDNVVENARANPGYLGSCSSVRVKSAFVYQLQTEHLAVFAPCRVLGRGQVRTRSSQGETLTEATCPLPCVSVQATFRTKSDTLVFDVRTEAPARPILPF